MHRRKKVLPREFSLHETSRESTVFNDRLSRNELSSSFSAQKTETSCSYRYEYNDAQLKREGKDFHGGGKSVKRGMGRGGGRNTIVPRLDISWCVFDELIGEGEEAWTGWYETLLETSVEERIERERELYEFRSYEWL